MEPLSIIISFVVSYLANNVPTIIELVQSNKSFESRLKGCYDNARKQWKCQAARDRYEGKEMNHLSDLQEYVIGHNEDIDPELQELLGRWVLELRKDPVCSALINDIKLDDIKGANAKIVMGVELAIRSMSEEIDKLSNKIDDLGEKEEDHFRKIIEKIDSIRSIESRDETIRRELYHLIQNESDHAIYCTNRVLRHGGVDWWGMIDNKRTLRGQIELLRAFMLKYQVYFSKTFFDEVISHYELAINLQCELDSLVMAIYSADDQDGITDVYYITYEQEIDWTPDFVSFMMGEFKKVDNHPSYDEYARLYRKHEESKNKLLAQIESKMGKAL